MLAEQMESFTGEGGVQCLLHEFGPAVIAPSVDSHALSRKRGRPKKGFEMEKISYQERMEKKEQRRQERKMNRLFLKSQENSSNQSSVSDSFANSPKKRGRPRKLESSQETESLDNLDRKRLFTPSCSDNSSNEEFSMSEMLKLDLETFSLEQEESELVVRNCNYSTTQPSFKKQQESSKQ